MGLYPKQVTEYLALEGIPRGYGSKIYVVDPVNGVDTNPGDRWTAPLKTVAAAEELCVTGRHDTVLLLAGTTADVLVAQLLWDKSFTHLIGLGAPGMLNSRARIFQTGDLNLSPLINITGSGCIFKNIYVSQEADDIGSTIAVQVTGGRNFFERCMFAGGGHATAAIDGGTNLILNGAEENYFKNCVIGRDSIVDATGWAALLFDDYARRNIFDGCIFMMYAGATACYFVEVVDNVGLDRWNLFKDSLFLNVCRTYTLGTVFNIPAAMASLTNFLIWDNCNVVGAGELDSNNRTVVVTTGSKPDAGGGNTGLMIASNTT